MNQKIIAVFVISILVLIGISFYFSGHSLMSGNDIEEMREHNDRLAPHEISPGDVVRKVQSSKEVVLLDVRTPEEYEEMHLKNALLLPVQELSSESLSKIGLGEEAKDKEIILYCRSGARSQTAYNIMKSLGYTNIKSIAGGMAHWEEDQYPLTESGAYTGSMMQLGIEEKVTVVEGPKAVVDRSLHNFGAIAQYGGTVETKFTVTNEGTGNLEIGTLTTSCSCTSATISKSSIRPGEEAVLTIVFNPNLHEEPLDVFKRTVFIPTNDPDNPEIEVSIQVDILENK